MEQLRKILEMVGSIEIVTSCPQCLGEAKESLVPGLIMPCQVCDGTGKVRDIIVTAIVQVPYNFRVVDITCVKPREPK